MPHLEAASILLVGPTLKKFNDRGILLYLSFGFCIDCFSLFHSLSLSEGMSIAPQVAVCYFILKKILVTKQIV